MPPRASGRHGPKTRNEKGYVRLYVKPHRGKYEHRVVMAEMCVEFCFYELQSDGLPAGFTVEHQDHVRTHNCRENLVLLQEIIHNYLSSHTKVARNRFLRYDGTVDWAAVVGSAPPEQHDQAPF
jgi:hypothetical protein